MREKTTADRSSLRKTLSTLAFLLPAGKAPRIRKTLALSRLYCMNTAAILAQHSTRTIRQVLNGKPLPIST